MRAGAAPQTARPVEADAALRRVPESALRAAGLTSPVGLAILRRSEAAGHEIVWLNPAAAGILGGGPAAGHGPGPALLAEAIASEGRAIDGRLVRADGSAAMARLRSARVSDAGDEYWVVHLEELSEQLRADEHLRASEEQFRALAANAPVGVFSSDIGLRLGYVNARMAAMLERPADELLGTGWLDAVHPDDLAAAAEAGSAVLAGGEVDLELRVLCPATGTRRLRVRATPLHRPGRGAGFVGSVEDVTDDRRHEEELSHQATHDPLTGLPNRALLYERLATLLDSPRQHPLALLFFDLDDFKLVNDSLGHGAGDHLLVEVAARMRAHLRPNDMVARVGGDEFIVLCPSIAREADAYTVAERLLDALRAPVIVAGRNLRVTASAGVAFAPPGDVTAADLVRDADAAMYQAKQAGKARVGASVLEAVRLLTLREQS